MVKFDCQPDLLRVTAQHARAQRVERAEPQSLDRPAEDRADPLAHLAGRLVGEGDRQHLAREGAAGQQDMGEAGGQHAGLAGAGAGEHQQRAVHGLDGFALLGVQAREVVGHRQDIGRDTALAKPRYTPRIIPPRVAGPPGYARSRRSTPAG